MKRILKPGAVLLVSLLMPVVSKAATYVVTAQDMDIYGGVTAIVSDGGAGVTSASANFGDPAGTFSRVSAREGLIEASAGVKTIKSDLTRYGLFSAGIELDFFVSRKRGFGPLPGTVDARATALFSSEFSNRGTVVASLGIVTSRVTFTHDDQNFGETSITDQMFSNIETLQVGKLYTLKMTLDGYPHVLTDGNSRVLVGEDGRVDSQLLLGGLPGGEVFDFLGVEGYSVNSVDGRIVDNLYVGSGAITAVPEPSTWVMLAIALLGLFGVTRRKTG